MEPTAERSGLLASLEASLCADADIEFAVAFGSQVAGESRPSSDLDVTIKFDDDLSAHNRFRKRCFLSGDLQQADAPFVDLSDIEELPVEVANDAVHGDLLCGDEDAFSQFKATIEEQFEEQRDDLRRQQLALIDRVAEEGLRG